MRKFLTFAVAALASLATIGAASPVLSLSDGNLDAIELFNPQGEQLEPTSEIDNSGYIIRVTDESVKLSADFGDFALAPSTIFVIPEESDFTYYLVDGQLDIILSEPLEVSIYTPTSLTMLETEGEYVFVTDSESEAIYNFSKADIQSYDALTGKTAVIPSMKYINRVESEDVRSIDEQGYDMLSALPVIAVALTDGSALTAAEELPAQEEAIPEEALEEPVVAEEITEEAIEEIPEEAAPEEPIEAVEETAEPEEITEEAIEEIPEEAVPEEPVEAVEETAEPEEITEEAIEEIPEEAVPEETFEEVEEAIAEEVIEEAEAPIVETAAEPVVISETLFGYTITVSVLDGTALVEYPTVVTQSDAAAFFAYEAEKYGSSVAGITYTLADGSAVISTPLADEVIIANVPAFFADIVEYVNLLLAPAEEAVVVIPVPVVQEAAVEEPIEVEEVTEEAEEPAEAVEEAIAEEVIEEAEAPVVETEAEPVVISETLFGYTITVSVLDGTALVEYPTVVTQSDAAAFFAYEAEKYGSYVAGITYTLADGSAVISTPLADEVIIANVPAFFADIVEYVNLLLAPAEEAVVVIPVPVVQEAAVEEPVEVEEAIEEVIEAVEAEAEPVVISETLFGYTITVSVLDGTAVVEYPAVVTKSDAAAFFAYEAEKYGSYVAGITYTLADGSAVISTPLADEVIIANVPAFFADIVEYVNILLAPGPAEEAEPAVKVPTAPTLTNTAELSGAVEPVVISETLFGYTITVSVLDGTALVEYPTVVTQSDAAAFYAYEVAKYGSFIDGITYTLADGSSTLYIPLEDEVIVSYVPAFFADIVEYVNLLLAPAEEAIVVIPVPVIEEVAAEPVVISETLFGYTITVSVLNSTVLVEYPTVVTQADAAAFYAYEVEKYGSYIDGIYYTLADGSSTLYIPLEDEVIVSYVPAFFADIVEYVNLLLAPAEETVIVIPVPVIVEAPEEAAEIAEEAVEEAAAEETVEVPALPIILNESIYGYAITFTIDTGSVLIEYPAVITQEDVAGFFAYEVEKYGLEYLGGIYYTLEDGAAHLLIVPEALTPEVLASYVPAFLEDIIEYIAILQAEAEEEAALVILPVIIPVGEEPEELVEEAAEEIIAEPVVITGSVYGYTVTVSVLDGTVVVGYPAFVTKGTVAGFLAYEVTKYEDALDGIMYAISEGQTTLYIPLEDEVIIANVPAFFSDIEEYFAMLLAPVAEEAIAEEETVEEAPAVMVPSAPSVTNIATLVEEEPSIVILPPVIIAPTEEIVEEPVAEEAMPVVISETLFGYTITVSVLNSTALVEYPSIVTQADAAAFYAYEVAKYGSFIDGITYTLAEGSSTLYIPLEDEVIVSYVPVFFDDIVEYVNLLLAPAAAVEETVAVPAAPTITDTSRWKKYQLWSVPSAPTVTNTATLVEDEPVLIIIPPVIIAPAEEIVEEPVIAPAEPVVISETLFGYTITVSVLNSTVLVEYPSIVTQADAAAFYAYEVEKYGSFIDGITYTLADGSSTLYIPLEDEVIVSYVPVFFDDIVEYVNLLLAPVALVIEEAPAVRVPSAPTVTNTATLVEDETVLIILPPIIIAPAEEIVEEPVIAAAEPVVISETLFGYTITVSVLNSTVLVEYPSIVTQADAAAFYAYEVAKYGSFIDGITYTLAEGSSTLYIPLEDEVIVSYVPVFFDDIVEYVNLILAPVALVVEEAPAVRVPSAPAVTNTATLVEDEPVVLPPVILAPVVETVATPSVISETLFGYTITVSVLNSTVLVEYPTVVTQADAAAFYAYEVAKYGSFIDGITYTLAEGSSTLYIPLEDEVIVSYVPVFFDDIVEYVSLLLAPAAASEEAMPVVISETLFGYTITVSVLNSTVLVEYPTVVTTADAAAFFAYEVAKYGSFIDGITYTLADGSSTLYIPLEDEVIVSYVPVFFDDIVEYVNLLLAPAEEPVEVPAEPSVAVSALVYEAEVLGYAIRITFSGNTAVIEYPSIVTASDAISFLAYEADKYGTAFAGIRYVIEDGSTTLILPGTVMAETAASYAPVLVADIIEYVGLYFAPAEVAPQVLLEPVAELIKDPVVMSTDILGYTVTVSVLNGTVLVEYPSIVTQADAAAFYAYEVEKYGSFIDGITYSLADGSSTLSIPLEDEVIVSYIPVFFEDIEEYVAGLLGIAVEDLLPAEEAVEAVVVSKDILGYAVTVSVLNGSAVVEYPSIVTQADAAAFYAYEVDKYGSYIDGITYTLADGSSTLSIPLSDEVIVSYIPVFFEDIEEYVAVISAPAEDALVVPVALVAAIEEPEAVEETLEEEAPEEAVAEPVEAVPAPTKPAKAVRTEAEPEEEHTFPFDLRLQGSAYIDYEGNYVPEIALMGSFSAAGFSAELSLDAYSLYNNLTDIIEGEDMDWVDWLQFGTDFVNVLRYETPEQGLTIAFDRNMDLEGDYLGILPRISKGWDKYNDKLSFEHTVNTTHYGHRLWLEDLAFNNSSFYEDTWRTSLAGADFRLMLFSDDPWSVNIGAVALLDADDFDNSVFYPEVSLTIPIWFSGKNHFSLFMGGAIRMDADDFLANPFSEHGFMAGLGLPMQFGNFKLSINAVFNYGDLHYGMLGESGYTPVDEDNTFTISAEASYTNKHFGLKAYGLFDASLSSIYVEGSDYAGIEGYVNISTFTLFGGFRAQDYTSILDDDFNYDYYFGIMSGVGPVSVYAKAMYDDGWYFRTGGSVSLLANSQRSINDSFTGKLPVRLALEAGMEEYVYTTDDAFSFPVALVTPVLTLGTDDFFVSLRYPVRLSFDEDGDIHFLGNDWREDFNFGVGTDDFAYNLVTDIFSLFDRIYLGDKEYDPAYLNGERNYTRNGLLFNNYGARSELGLVFGVDVSHFAMELYFDDMVSPRMSELYFTVTPTYRYPMTITLSASGETLWYGDSFDDFLGHYYPGLELDFPVTDWLSIKAFGYGALDVSSASGYNNVFFYDTENKEMADWLAGGSFDFSFSHVSFSLSGGYRDSSLLRPDMFNAVMYRNHDTLSSQYAYRDEAVWAKASFSLSFKYFELSLSYSLDDILLLEDGFGDELDVFSLEMAGNIADNVSIWVKYSMRGFGDAISSVSNFYEDFFESADSTWSAGLDFTFSNRVSFSASVEADTAYAVTDSQVYTNLVPLDFTQYYEPALSVRLTARVVF